MKTATLRPEVQPIERAYSVLTIKAFDEEKRTIEGIATTASTDRMGDIIETDGIEFKLPLPLLFQHNPREPIGSVLSAKVSKGSISIKAQIAPTGIAPYIDQAWALLKAGLVRGLSIGFRPLEHAWMDDADGIRFIRSEWMELSAVTIPANAEATILTVKSADSAALAALGDQRTKTVVRLPINLPGVSGSAKTKGIMQPTIRETIASSEAKVVANEARIDELVKLSITEGRTAEDAEKEEIETLQGETKKLTEHIALLKSRETSMIARATVVTAATTAAAAEAVRVTSPIQVRSMLPKGIGVARMAIAMIRAKGNPYQAIEIAKTQWGDQPEVAMHLKSVVEAGDTTTSGWASQLLPAAQTMSGDFLEMLRPLLIMGKLPLKDVPFNVSVPLQSGGGTYGYVGEGAPKPVTKPTYGSATLRFEKAAGIIVITQELARFSNPKAELLVRDEMLKGLSNYFDTIFVGTSAAVTNVMPAGILNGKSATAATGTTAARFRYDMNTMIQIFITNNQDISTARLLMSSGLAMSLSSMINSLGQNEFPSINASGGNYLGIPIVVSQNLGTNIILIQPGDILLAEDPAITIDVSTEASVEMDTAPAGGESSPITDVSTLKSLWQNNLVGIRAEQFRTWKVGRTSAVEYISGAAYTPPTS